MKFSKSFYGPFVVEISPDDLFSKMVTDYQADKPVDFADQANGLLRFMEMDGRKFAIYSMHAIHGEDAQTNLEMLEVDNPDCMNPANMYSGDSFQDLINQV